MIKFLFQKKWFQISGALLLTFSLNAHGQTVSDDFSVNGSLQGYTTNNLNSLPNVSIINGRYRAELLDNTDNISLHFNKHQGRLDAKLVSFPFNYIARNIGIGSQDNSQSAPLDSSSLYIFAGIQVHVPDLESRNSSHIVVGHRGKTHFTIEGKNTVDGVSSVNDEGLNSAPEGRADIRVQGNDDNTLTIYWQIPNLTGDDSNDNWNLYKGNGKLPNNPPAYGDSVYIGLITYAQSTRGIPFVGTCDGIEFVDKK